MLLSKSCVYGLRASLFLASNQNGEYISIKKLSATLDISFHFLTKILQRLTAAELLESLKGPNGGVRLSKPGKEISLLDVVVAIDGNDLLQECVLGLPGCGVEEPCPLHNIWTATRDGIQEMLETNSLVDMAKSGKQGNLRITPEGNFQWTTVK
jgi:Rrf2 family protein